MKKSLAVILAVLMLFSAVSVLAFAEGEETRYTINFVDYDGRNIRTVLAEENMIVPAPENPTREAEGNYEYVFKGWSSDGGVNCYQSSTIPLATKNVTYMAIYETNEKQEVITFWGFIASIFARINQIFEYFYDIFTRGLEQG